MLDDKDDDNNDDDNDDNRDDDDNDNDDNDDKNDDDNENLSLAVLNQLPNLWSSSRTAREDRLNTTLLCTILCISTLY